MVRVDDGERTLLDATYGPMPADAVCRVGSLTKSFTAAAVYALQDEGLLSVDDPIGALLPEVHAVIGDGPPLRQLMVHAGGLSEPQANAWMPPPTWEEQSRVMLPQLRVEEAPGVRVRYSNFGYTLLAAVAARVSGRSFEEVVATRLLDPLGMADTGIDRVPDLHARMLRGRVASPLGLLDAQRALPRLIVYDARWPHGGDGAITSTPADLVRWARGLRDGVILSDASRAALIRAESDDLAAGWVRDGARVWHNGALYPLGIYAYLRWSVEDDVVVALCGTPTVGDVRPEWRVPVEAALAGAPIGSPRVATGPFGLAAAISAAYLHWVFALLGVVVAGAVRGTRAARIGAACAGVGAAALGLGLTHAALGALGAAIALAASVWRWRAAPPTAWGRRSWVAAALGALFGAACLLLLALVLAFSWMIESVWSLGA